MIENILKDFKDYLIQLGYGKSSCFMLPRCVASFLSYRGKQDPGRLSTVDVQEFYEWLHQRPNQRKGGALSEAYIHHHVYGLKVFFAWLEETGQIRCNPMSVMKFKNWKATPKEPLTQQEIQSLFSSVKTLKEQAMLHLFYSCGLRSSEGEGLNIRDIHFKKQVLYVREGKGNKRRAVPMPYKVAMELESYYLTQRVTEKKVRDSEAFMLNKTGSRMKGLSFNRLLKQLLERVELRKEVSLHHLRHSIATHLLESGLSIERVRDFLGHRHLESTQVYTKVAQGQLNHL